LETQRLMSSDNRATLHAGFTNLIRSAHSPEGLAAARNDPTYYDTITIASPNLAGKSSANFPQSTPRDANRQAPPLPTITITQDELLLLATTDEEDTDFPPLRDPAPLDGPTTSAHTAPPPPGPLPSSTVHLEEDTMSQSSSDSTPPTGSSLPADHHSSHGSYIPYAMATPPRGTTAQAASSHVTPHHGPPAPTLRHLIMEQLHDAPHFAHPRSEHDQVAGVNQVLTLVSEALDHCPRPLVHQAVQEWAENFLSDMRTTVQPQQSFQPEDSAGTQLDTA
jgi:hypothetical protein